MLLQNATEVYYKMRQVFYYKMRQFYYKMRQLLQNATILLQNATVTTKCDDFITNCDSTCTIQKIFSLNTMNKDFLSNLLSQASIEQGYLSKNVKKFSFWGV